MRWIAALLLVAVFLRHNGANWLASLTDLSPFAAFYVLGGAWEALLCAAILVLVLAFRDSLWRRVLQCAAIVGLIEGAQMVGCRVAVGADIKAVPRGMNLCDWLAGFPVGGAITSLYLLAIVWILGRGEPRPA